MSSYIIKVIMPTKTTDVYASSDRYVQTVYSNKPSELTPNLYLAKKFDDKDIARILAKWFKEHPIEFVGIKRSTDIIDVKVMELRCILEECNT